MRTRKWLTSIRGEHVAFTGKAWLIREELERAVRRRGGIPCGVTGETTVLIRGESQAWAFREYGLKEKKAAEWIQRGHDIRLVHDFEFRKLLEDRRPAHVSDYIAGQPVQWLQHVAKKEFEQTAALEGPLDREHSVKGAWNKAICGGLCLATALSQRAPCAAGHYPLD